MDDKSNQEPIFEGLTSWTTPVEVRPVRVTTRQRVDPRCVYVVLQDCNGASSFVFKKEAAGKLAVDIFGALAALGDANSRALLDTFFKRR